MPKISELPAYSGTPSDATIPVVISGETYKITQDNLLSDSKDFAIARANHTGTQAISTVTDLQTTLDSKRVSTDSKLVSVVEETFIGGWGDVNAQSYGNGTLQWHVARTGSSGLGSAYSEPGNPACPIFQGVSGAHTAQLLNLRMQGTSTMIGCSFEWKFKPAGGATGRYFFGFRNYAVADAETSMRGLFLDLVAGDTNWQCLHQTTAGVQTKVSTGKAYSSGQWVNAKITIVSATETDITISTTGSPTPVTTRITGGYDFTSYNGMGWKVSSSSGTPVLLYMSRFIATLVRTEF